MKILSANKRNAVIRVNKKELEAITTALIEWGLIEDTAIEPDKKILETYDEMATAIARFKLDQFFKIKALDKKEIKKIEVIK